MLLAFQYGRCRSLRKWRKYEHRYAPILLLIREMNIIRSELKEFKSYIELTFAKMETRIDEKFDKLNRLVNEVDVGLSQRIDKTNKRVDGIYKYMIKLLIAVIRQFLIIIVKKGIKLC